jgi:hypothetical protein
MATEGLPMRKSKEILRQKWLLGRRHRQIASACAVRAGLHSGVGRRIVLQRSLSRGTGLLREPRIIIW